MTSLSIDAISEVDTKDNFRILRQIPVRLTRMHGIDFDSDAVWCMFANDILIQKIDLKTGRPVETVQLAKEDPDPHGMCMHDGRLYYSDAGIAVTGKPNNSPSAGYICRIDL